MGSSEVSLSSYAMVFPITCQHMVAALFRQWLVLGQRLYDFDKSLLQR